MNRESTFVVATDVGGTCTDTVVFAEGEEARLGKALSTPPVFGQGVLDSVASAARDMGLSLGELLARTTLFVHGSTVVDNAIFTREGAAVGLVTTEGFEDTVLVTRGAYGRWGGLTEDRTKHMVRTERAAPLVEPTRIAGVPERTDYKGEVIRPLDEAAAEEALRRLLDSGAEAVAVCLLWSFRNAANERKVKALLERIAPHVYCTISSDIAPTPGEYERTSTTVINAYAGRIARDYLLGLQELLAKEGYRGPLLIMQGYGGLLPAAEATNRAIGMLECGPAAGVIGSLALGRMLGHRDIIAADMGGTTFKVSVLQDGEIEHAREPMVDRFHYTQPKIEVISIGAAGGSVVWLEPRTRVPRVGPRSAGSRPGPVCYGLGGTEPTLTDVFMLVGYMDPARFLGGTMRLDADRARAVFAERIAEPLGLGVEEAAFGIYRLASAQITDLVRQITVERGLDPRDYVLHAFGGSCGMVCGMFGEELGVRSIVVPYTASVNCAFGLVSADIAHEFSTVAELALPCDPERLERSFAAMRDKALSALADEGFTGERVRLERAADLRYRRQVHEVTTPVRGEGRFDAAAFDALAADFETLYERKYGKGSAYREAGIEITQLRLTAKGLLERPHWRAQALGSADSSQACIGRRPIFVEARSAMVESAIFDFERLRPGNVVAGPAVIHTPITTVVLQHGQRATVDAYRNIVIEFG